MLIAVNYHYVRTEFADPYPSIYGVTPTALQRQLELLGRVGQFVSAEDVRDAIGVVRPIPQNAILVTFDDGLREQFDNAWPVLNLLGIPAVFFVNTHPIINNKVSSVHKVHLLRSQIAPDDFTNMLSTEAQQLGIDLNWNLNGATQKALAQYPYDSHKNAKMKFALNVLLPVDQRNLLIDKCFNQVFTGREAMIACDLYMDFKQMNRLGHCGCLGTHGHEHLPLAQLPKEKAAKQIELSLSYLEAWSGTRPFALSYPYGSVEACSEELGCVAGELGISFALTMERAGNEDLRRPLQLARFDCNDLPGGSAPKFDLHNLFESVPRALSTN